MTKNNKFLQNRRNFLKLSALAGVGTICALGFSQKERFKSTPIDHKQQKTQVSRIALGTSVSITAIHSSKSLCEDAIGAAFQDVQKMEGIFSRYDNLSPLCELNDTLKLSYVPQEMLELFEICQHFYRKTQGAFDISVKPILDLLARSQKLGESAKKSELKERLALVGSEKILQKSNAILLPLPGMGLSFDGVSPGFIADRAAKILESYGIRRYLIDAGGEIKVSGFSPNDSEWRIAIQDPNKKGNFPGLLKLNRGAVSTSGSYEIQFSNNGALHHIVDAKSGASPAHCTSVTVIAPTAVEADILSTAVFVMGPKEGIQFINANPQYSCLIIDKEAKQYASSNFMMEKIT